MSLHLEFSGAPSIGAPRATVWGRLLDPHFVAASAPGVESIDVLGPNRFQVVASVRAGLIPLRLPIEVELSDLAEPERAKLRASVSAGGSTVAVTSAVRLEAPTPDRTVLHWAATAEIDGALAGFGGQFVEGIARKLTADFWDDFARRVEATP